MISSSPRDLDDALGRLTLCLETPCVPGELEEWAANVRAVVEALGRLLLPQISTNHRDQYATIVAEDAEMQRQVVQLEKEDQLLLVGFVGLAQRSRRLAEEAPRVEPDEAKLHEEVAALIKEGLAFVLRWQQQQVAIRNWLQEAFTRERGVMD